MLHVLQDGHLDADEVAHWILPGEVDHTDNEAKHLIYETDTDKVDPPHLEPCASTVHVAPTQRRPRSTIDLNATMFTMLENIQHVWALSI